MEGQGFGRLCCALGESCKDPEDPPEHNLRATPLCCVACFSRQTEKPIRLGRRP